MTPVLNWKSTPGPTFPTGNMGPNKPGRPDRPNVAESSQVVGKGRLQLETGLQWERRRDDAIRLQERIGHPQPGVEVLPRRSQLVFVLAHVHVDAVHAEDVRGPCAAHRRLEPRVARDDVVGEDAPVAAPADPKPLAIRNASTRDTLKRLLAVLQQVPVT